MGFLNDVTNTLFGGTNQSSNSYINPAQNQQLGNLYNYAGGLLNQYQGNPQSLIAGFTPNQIAGQNYAQNAANGVLQNLAQQGNQGFAQSLNYDPTQSPYYASALQSTFNPFVRNFLTNVLPGIRSQAVGVGRAGSGREGIAQGLATQGLLQQLGDISASTANNAYNTGAQTRLSALNLLPTLQQANLAPAEVLQSVGGQQQALNQQYLNAPFTLGSLYQGLLGNPTVLQNSQGSTSPGLIGGLSDAARGAGSLFSGLGSVGLRY